MNRLVRLLPEFRLCGIAVTVEGTRPETLLQPPLAN